VTKPVESTLKFVELKSNGAATSLRQQDVAGTSAVAQFGLNFSYQL